MRAACRFHCVALALVAVAAPSVSLAQKPAVQIHRAQPGDTLELLAAEYYGDRRHAIFIMIENKITHPRPLRRHERLRIPVSQRITASVGDTLTGLAEEYLGDERRARFLAEFNKLEDHASIAAGQPLVVPFTVKHKAAGQESLRDIAAAFFRDPKKASLLKEYNFLDKDVLARGETIIIPIYHVRVQASKLPQQDAESAARATKRLEMQEQARAVLPGAMSAWEDGDFTAVKRQLTKIDMDYLDTSLAVQVGVLLGGAYVAFDDEDSALATFTKVVERQPDYRLSAYRFSPRIRDVWKRAGGKIDHKARR